ncbi:MAG: DNA-3-methyladenine glycosylase family protein [Pyrinomonadaceae bacterium]
MHIVNGITRLDSDSLLTGCEALAASDDLFASVLEAYGTPPMWERPTGFATMLHIILEQQVSLASAKACFDKLSEKLGSVSPGSLLKLDDVELRAVGLSRQKSAYARHLSEAIIDKRIQLEGLDQLPDGQVKSELMTLKGVGHWTADIYLLMAMLRPDVMPKGDLALHAAYQKLTGAGRRPGADEFVVIAEKWRPYRSVAARLLWHFYLSVVRQPARK